MAYSELSVNKISNTNLVSITAYGGTRRQRGAAIAAWVRRNKGATQQRKMMYSEAFGFEHATYATYELN